MGVRFPFVASNTIVNGTIVTTTDTVIITSPAINLTYDGALVLLLWFVRLSTGVGVTAVNYSLRRGTLATSPLVTVATISVAEAASTAVMRSSSYFDSPGIVANQQYSLTLAQIAATGNGTVSDASIAAFML